MVELAPHDAKFEVLTREHQLYLAAIFEETIARGIAAGELGGSVDRRAIAQSLVTAFVGITVLKKSNPGPEWIGNALNRRCRCCPHPSVRSRNKRNTVHIVLCSFH
ncbi:hypothetical protein [Cohnella sp. 56]|uniref:hypothetical protein n=1 Tax=Cohnella sp. 56 TaxID=3113722 RepID=UPI00403FD774